MSGSGGGSGSATPLEEFFLGIVAAEMGSEPRGLPHRAEAIAALRRVFSSPPSDDEERLASQGPGGGTAEARASARVRSALKEALAAVHGSAPGRPPEPPNVIVLGGSEGNADGRSVEQTLSLTLGASLASIVEEGKNRSSSVERPASVPRTLVLADESAVSELKDVPSIDVLGRSLPIAISASPGGTLADASPSAAKGDSIQVVPIPATLDIAKELAPGLPPSAPAAGAGGLVGSIVDGKYEVVRELGRGGFGSVVEAKDRILGARVAIKFLNPHVARSKESLKAFKAEAKRVTDLEHPNIVGWKTFGETPDGTRYFVMEYLEGQDLEKAMKTEKALRPRRTARILLQCLDALRQAHKKSILHLDLKPRNVYLLPAEGSEDEQDLVKVIDFGIGQYMGGKDVVSAEAGSGTFVMPHKGGRATIRRCTGCTPEYASPEQCGHMLPGDDIADLDGRSDLYSLGVMAFQMLTGELPFEAPPKEKRRDWYRLHREEPPKKVRAVNSKVPRPLAAFVDRCLAKSPDERFADTNEAFEKLDRWVHPPVLVTAAKMAGVAIVPLAIAGLLIVRGVIDPPEFKLSRDEKKLVNLYLGSETPSATLDVAGLDVADGEVDPRLCRLDGTEVPGVECRWDTSTPGAVKVTVSVPPDSASIAVQSAQLRAGTGLAKTRRSEDFAFGFVGRDALEILGIDFGAKPNQLVDPVGGTAKVSVRASDRSVLRSVMLESGSWNGTVVSPAGREESSDLLVFEVPLLGLRGSESTTFTAIVEDIAGGKHSFPWAVKLATHDLGFERVSHAGDASLMADRVRVWNGARASLRVVLNGRADLTWKALIGEEEIARGEPLDDPKLANSREFEISFGFLDGRPEKTEGTIVLACDDSSYVHRGSPDRGKDEEKLNFLVTREIRPWIELRRRDGGPIGRDSRPSDTGEPAADLHFVGSRDIDLCAGLESPINVWVVTALASPGGADSKTFPPALMRNSLTMKPLPLALSEPGLHEIELAFFYYVDGDTPESFRRGREPDRVEKRSVVLDETPATIVVRPAGAGGGGTVTPVVSSAEDSIAFEIEVTDSPPEGGVAQAHPTPVDLRFTLRRFESEGDRRVEHKIETPEPIARIKRIYPGKNEPVRFFPAEPNSPVSKDGEYVLTCDGRDLTGREARSAEFKWAVSTSGPTMVWVSPSKADAEKGEKWNPTPAWRVRVVVNDPNGVERVTCRVERIEKNGAASIKPQIVALAPEGGSAWAGSADLNGFEWAEGKVARVVVEAYDKAGQRSEDSVEIGVGEAKGHFPNRIQAVIDGFAPKYYLRLIDGNRNDKYVCGGTGDSEENRLYKRFGNWGSFNSEEARFREEFSWRVEIPREGITPYYLGECEVSREWFEAFLVRAGAESAGIELDRRSALERAMKGRDGSWPATSIRWLEAAAFARWMGMRLPSYAEWEFAVRGGSAYRVFSCPSEGTSEDLTSLGKRVVITVAGQERREPVPVGTSADETPDSRIRDLCGNVSEWTASPDLRGTPEWKQSLVRPQDLRIDLSSAKMWYVGANYATFQRVDFFKLNKSGARDLSEPTIGFRLAVDRKVVADAMNLGPVPGSIVRIEKAPDDEAADSDKKK